MVYALRHLSIIAALPSVYDKTDVLVEIACCFYYECTCETCATCSSPVSVISSQLNKFRLLSCVSWATCSSPVSEIS